MVRCLFVFTFIITLASHAQVRDRQLLSGEFIDRPAAELLDFLQEHSGYQFFYKVSWIDSLKVTVKFQNQPVENILQDAFRGTPIKSFVFQDKMILTSGYVIADNVQSADQAISNDTVEITTGRKDIIRSVVLGSPASPRPRSTITGYIKVQGSQEPVPGATVFIDGVRKGVTTDGSGFYAITIPPGDYNMIVRFVGMEDQLIALKAYGDGTVNFHLESAAIVLNEVMIEADRDLLVTGTQMGISRLDPGTSKNVPKVLGENDLIKVALTMPGVKSVGEGAAGLNVRGGNADQNLVILNEATIYNTAHFLGFFSVFNSDAIQSFDLYKSAIPAQYGGRLSSIIDIRMKDGNQEKFSGQGGISPITSQLTLEVPLVKDKTSLIIGGRSTYSNWILKQLDYETVKRSSPSFYDAFARLTHHFSKRSSVYLTGYYSKDRFELPFDSLFSYHNAAASLQWRFIPNSRLQWLFSLTQSDYKFQIGYQKVPDNAFEMGFAVRESNAKWNVNYDAGRHKLSAGLQAKLYALQPGYINRPSASSLIEERKVENEKGLEGAVFFDDQWEISENFSISGGIRYSAYAALGPRTVFRYNAGQPRSVNSVADTSLFKANEHVSQYGGAEWRLSARYKISSESSIKGSYNRTRQFIHMLSNTVSVSPTNTWKLSDPSIKPQYADQVSLGFYQIFGATMEFSLETYYKNMYNILDYKTGSAVLLNERIEMDVLQGDGKAYGIEAFLRKKSGKLTGWLAYTYSRALTRFNSELPAETINNGKYFPANYDKPHDLSVVSNYKITRRYSISMNFMYATGRPITYPVGAYRLGNGYRINYSERNEYRLDDYIRMDIGFNIEGNHRIKKLAHSFWSISIYNLLGRRNPYSVYFVANEGKIRAYQLSIFGAPIPTVTYNFKF